jgi:hypothetical protein
MWHWGARLLALLGTVGTGQSVMSVACWGYKAVSVAKREFVRPFQSQGNAETVS